MKAGVGYGNDKDPFALGRKVAEDAMKQGGAPAPGLVLAFCGGQVDAARYYEGLRSVVGEEAPIIGGSAVGIITNDDLSYDGYPAGAAVLSSDGLHVEIASADQLDRDERTAGRDLAEQLHCTSRSKALLVFYDSVKVSPTADDPPVMNASPHLIQGMDDVLKGCVPIIGAGVIGDFLFSPTKQFRGSSVGDQSVVGALMGGAFSVYHSIMHGCTPMDGVYHRITKIDGPVIFEVDGRPVVQVIDELYDDQTWMKQMPVKRLTIGVNHGSRGGEFQEEAYVNRLIAGALPNREGIVLFEPDLAEGTEFLFMLRDSHSMMESARRNAAALMEQVLGDGKRPWFGLYIDCAGRTAAFSETPTEEAAELRNVLNRYKVPFLGFYSGVEIAPLLGKSRGLDWTGVLVLFAES